MSNQNQSELGATLVLEDRMSGPLQKAAAELDRVGKSFEQLQRKAQAAMKPLQSSVSAVAAGSGQMATGFNRAEAAQTRMLARSARLATALYGLQTISQTLGRNFEGGEFGRGLKAGMDGLTTFGSIVTIMPNKLGLVVGGLAGLTVGLSGAFGPSESLRKSLAAVAESLESIRKNRSALAEAGERNRIEAGVRADTGRPMTDVEKVERERDRVQADLVALKRLKEQLDAAPLRARLDDPEFGKNMERIREIEALTEKLRGLNSQLKDLDETAKQMKALDEVATKVRALNQQSEDAKTKLEAGLIEPLEEAELQLKLTEKAVEELFAARELMGEERFKDAFDHLANEAKTQRAKIEGTKAQADLQKKMQRDAERAMEQWQAQWVGFFDSIGQGFADVFADAIVQGKSMTKGLQGLFKDLQKSLIRMLMDTALGGMFRSAGAAFAGTMAPAFGVPAAGGGHPGQAPGQPPSVNIQQQAQQGISAFSFGSAGGSSYMGAAVGVGTAAGGYVMQRGVEKGSPWVGAAGGALAGAAMGAVFGPVGIVVGAIAGAALGYFAADDAKKEEEKMKERQREQEEAARLEHERMVEQAKGLIKMHIRTNYSGGLATEEAMGDISKLFSGDVSAEEVESFGAENVVARRGEIESQAAGVDVGGITINVQAHVAGQWDVQRLAESLGYHVQRQIQSAAAGAQ
jgi:hypothetical protein